MCNFVPRECIAFGHLVSMKESVSDWLLPGVVRAVPLLPEGTDYGQPTPFDGYGFLHVTNIPDGLEVLAVSKLSAALSSLIGQHLAVVELNAYLDYGSAKQYGRNSLSPTAQRVITRLNRYTQLETAEPCTVAVLDSGVDPDAMRLCGTHVPYGSAMSIRDLVAIDYLDEDSPSIVDPHQIADPLGHGAVVCRILDMLLPQRVSFSIGRVARGRSDVTALYLARCYAHMVATQKPKVVNLSLAPLQDFVICPHCDSDVPIGCFHSLTLPRVFQLASNSTWTVMAAGNKGRACNADHFLADNEKLVYATAIDSSGKPASYSNYIVGENARSLAAFGGDPTQDERGQGILKSGSMVAGTSFAAPFVSAAILALDQGGTPRDIVHRCSEILAEVHNPN